MPATGAVAEQRTIDALAAAPVADAGRWLSTPSASWYSAARATSCAAMAAASAASAAACASLSCIAACGATHGARDWFGLITSVRESRQHVLRFELWVAEAWLANSTCLCPRKLAKLSPHSRICDDTLGQFYDRNN